MPRKPSLFRTSLARATKNSSSMKGSSPSNVYFQVHLRAAFRRLPSTEIFSLTHKSPMLIPNSIGASAKKLPHAWIATWFMFFVFGLCQSTRRGYQAGERFWLKLYRYSITTFLFRLTLINQYLYPIPIFIESGLEMNCQCCAPTTLFGLTFCFLIFSWYWPGERPVHRRKARQKLLLSMKPSR